MTDQSKLGATCPQPSCYECWFTGTAERTAVKAGSRKEAIELFADLKGITVSGYIQCKKL